MVGCSVCFSLIYPTDISESLPHLTHLISTVFPQASHKVQFGHHYLYIRLLPSIIKHSLVVGYADDHTLLMTIPTKDICGIAADHLNADLAALHEYGKPCLLLQRLLH